MSRTQIARWIFILLGFPILYFGVEYAKVLEYGFFKTILVLGVMWGVMLGLLDTYLPRKKRGTSI